MTRYLSIETGRTSRPVSSHKGEVKYGESKRKQSVWYGQGDG